MLSAIDSKWWTTVACLWVCRERGSDTSKTKSGRIHVIYLTLYSEGRLHCSAVREENQTVVDGHWCFSQCQCGRIRPGGSLSPSCPFNGNLLLIRLCSGSVCFKSHSCNNVSGTNWGLPLCSLETGLEFRALLEHKSAHRGDLSKRHGDSNRQDRRWSGATQECRRWSRNSNFRAGKMWQTRTFSNPHNRSST